MLSYTGREPDPEKCPGELSSMALPSVATLTAALSLTWLPFMGKITWQCPLHGSMKGCDGSLKMSRVWCTSVAMETSSLVTIRLSAIHNGVTHVDSGSDDGRRAVLREKATLTLMTSHRLQDVSWVPLSLSTQRGASLGAPQLRA